MFIIVNVAHHPGQVMSATLWAGTNSGTIYVFTIAIPPTDKRKELPITVQLGKEIHLKHAAPVLSVTILDGGCGVVWCVLGCGV